jgi:hypothetical protein
MNEDDNKLESILIHPRATTLHLVKLEAVRRCKADVCDRIIYACGADILIRLVGEDKAGDQTSLCHVRHDGKITDIETKGR